MLQKSRYAGEEMEELEVVDPSVLSDPVHPPSDSHPFLQLCVHPDAPAFNKGPLQVCFTISNGRARSIQVGC